MSTPSSKSAPAPIGNHVHPLTGASGGTGGSGGGIANAEFIDDTYAPGIRLNAMYKKGFGYKTIGYRLPVILTKIIDQLSRDKNAIGAELGSVARDEIKSIVGQLAQLKNELQTNKPIRLLPVVPRSTECKTPEKVYTIWNDYLQHMGRTMDCAVEEVRWYNAPWLYVECYLYQRIHDAFTCSTTHFNSFDYFRSQKQEGYHGSIKEIGNLAEFMASAEAKGELGSQATQQVLLHLSLWGNRSDLSLSAGEEASHNSLDLMQQLSSLEEQCLLCDESSQFWKKLQSGSSSSSIGYVLDNAGFELFTDLCFADALVSRDNASHVTFYVKTVPWFISDTMAHDIPWLLDTMASSESNSISHLASRWKAHFGTQRFRVHASPFWTYPHTYCEMRDADPALYQQLQSHTALIFKGDLNYRKLVQDKNWRKSTPFVEALGGFRPAPLLALRTVKADTVAGVEQSKADWLDQNKADWMETGEYGLMQFADGK